LLSAVVGGGFCGLRLLGGLLARLRGHLDRRGGGPDAELALTDDGVDAGDVALHGTHAAVALQVTGCGLEAQVEQLFLGTLQLVDETIVFEGVELGSAELLGSNGHYASPSSRLMMRALSGSLWMARVSAPRASSSETPETSNSTRPGL